MKEHALSRAVLRAFNRLFIRSWKLKRPPSKRVAIVIPLSTRATLTADEQVSLRHLHHYLGQYDRFFIAPEGLQLEFPENEVKRFHPKFFGSVGAHTRLLYWPGLYRAFADYDYIFFYHLDSLAFSDQLLEWCDLGVDYIGAPWLKCPDTPWVTTPRVGNCGFALLRVEPALHALYNRYENSPGMFWLDLFTRNADLVAPIVDFLRRFQPRFPKSRLVNRPIEEWDWMQNPGPSNRNTDIFWSDKAVCYMPEFKVATFEQGLRFAFEASPRLCLELNGGAMPFGCHAWPRYDRKFWEPLLLDPRDVVQSAQPTEPATAA